MSLWKTGEGERSASGIVLVTAPVPPSGSVGRPRLDLADLRLREAFGDCLERIESRAAPWPVLEVVHQKAYLERIVRLRGGHDRLFEQRSILAGSLESILLSAGAAADAVEAVTAGRASQAFVLSEPPGHHASADHGSGFCVLNNMAVAVATAASRGLERFLVIDWDVHHGDGTQSILGSWPGVAVVDLHQSQLFPGTGASEEVGGGDVWNVPLPSGGEDRDYAWLLRRMLRPLARKTRPQLVLISSGFDPHADDPLGGMSLTDAGFGVLAACAREVADEFCDGRVVALLEGGYAPAAVARSVVEVVRALAGEPRDRAASTEPRESTVTALEATAAAHVSCCGCEMRDAILR